MRRHSLGGVYIYLDVCPKLHSYPHNSAQSNPNQLLEAKTTNHCSHVVHSMARTCLTFHGWGCPSCSASNHIAVQQLCLAVALQRVAQALYNTENVDVDCCISICRMTTEGVEVLRESDCTSTRLLFKPSLFITRWVQWQMQHPTLTIQERMFSVHAEWEFNPHLLIGSNNKVYFKTLDVKFKRPGTCLVRPPGHLTTQV